jgi:NAD(P)H dehydrogenase (quinone)
MKRTILITGASGAVGGRVARLLTGRGSRLRLLIRSSARNPGLRGAQIAIGDYADRASLPAAFDGIDIALLSSP